MKNCRIHEKLRGQDDDKRSTDISDLSHAAQHGEAPKKTTKKSKKKPTRNTGVKYSQALQDQNPAEYR